MCVLDTHIKKEVICLIFDGRVIKLQFISFQKRLTHKTIIIAVKYTFLTSLLPYTHAYIETYYIHCKSTIINIEKERERKRDRRDGS